MGCIQGETDLYNRGGTWSPFYFNANKTLQINSTTNPHFGASVFKIAEGAILEPVSSLNTYTNFVFQCEAGEWAIQSNITLNMTREWIINYTQYFVAKHPLLEKLVDEDFIKKVKMHNLCDDLFPLFQAPGACPDILVITGSADCLHYSKKKYVWSVYETMSTQFQHDLEN